MNDAAIIKVIDNVMHDMQYKRYSLAYRGLEGLKYDLLMGRREKGTVEKNGRNTKDK